VDRDATFALAEVEFDGVRRLCHMACVTEAQEGDYVLVHAGLAISRVDEAAARRVIEELASLGESGEPAAEDSP
jgi:hydrogenase expression/formation protein HypC